MPTLPESSQIGELNALELLAKGIQAVVHMDPKEMLEQIQMLLSRSIMAEGLLHETQREGSPDRYTRHLLYADTESRFSIVSLVWQPGQCTPIHGHHTWCVYSILEGEMKEECYSVDEGHDRALMLGHTVHGAGDGSHSIASARTAHRLVNQSTRKSISIHVYGVPAENVATHVNRVVQGYPGGRH